MQLYYHGWQNFGMLAFTCAKGMGLRPVEVGFAQDGGKMSQFGFYLPQSIAFEELCK